MDRKAGHRAHHILAGEIDRRPIPTQQIRKARAAATEAAPFLVPEHHGYRAAMPGDERGLAPGGLLHHRLEGRLGVPHLKLPHRRP